MDLKLQISIGFDGQCEAAFRFYEKCLNGKIAYLLKWADSPASGEVPPQWGDKVYHATLHIAGTAITGADLPPDRYEAAKGFQLVLQTDDPPFADRAFEALGEEGTIVMPLQETFWARRFGALVDRFGISWSINCE